MPTTDFDKIIMENSTDMNNSRAMDEEMEPSLEAQGKFGDDGMLQYVPSGDVINPAEYVSLGDGTIRACQFLRQNGTVNETTIYSFFRYSPTQTTLSLAGTTLSLASLFITLVCYITFPTLRRLVSNQLIMAFCGTLFVAQCLFLFGGMASSVSQNLCRTLAAFLHFFWLSVFTLSSSIAFDLRRTFGSNKTIRVSTASRKVLLLYIAVATGIPLLIVVISLILSVFIGDDIDLHYGNELACWVGGGKANLVVFGVPVVVLLAFNFSCFIDTIRGISHSKRDSMTLHEGTENRSNHQELLKIAIKISSLMGFTWLFGFVAAFSKHQAVWYIFIILNSLQGVYIFLAFAATRRVFDLWRGLVLEKTVDTSLRDSSLQLRDRSTSSSVQKTSI
ncbi:adhesion G-protein coupled receptor G2-like [Strongylocentrotus purpuratus]|uniref:G-protein coupled receptors family 2 profile 2 domain-containing protein n=1 Tax=Strongylocentrotus purpuratus TaxID=7668 RepID=A0A7M7HIT8_STRPU|nr:adhesion G-protein coupled receptor G2-like [Strongylocentrotus purpuratus]